MREYVARRTAVALILVAIAGASTEAQATSLKNEHLSVEFKTTGDSCKMVRLARSDGTDALDVDSDEFEILLFDGSRFTVENYELDGQPNKSLEDGMQVLQVRYKRKAATSPKGPRSVTVTHELASGPYIHKTVELTMKEGEKIDRLQVLRFSTPQKASLGGFGQPIFVGNWFFGMDYPGFYSRHSDGFIEPDFYYRWYYDIDLDGRDAESAPRGGLVTLFHFPGFARKKVDGGWAVVSKRAVAGLSRQEGDSAELALLDYISKTRKKPRSYLHYNNWYSSEAKVLSIENFVNKIYKPIQKNLARHGAVLRGMVPDHGWQNGKTFKRIFEPKIDDRYDPLPEISKALIADGPTRLGIWIALDGTNQSIPHGLKIGYKPAYVEGFERTRRWMQGKAYFDILDRKYISDLKQSLRYLIVDAQVDYIKHDFNHNFTSGYITERHAREQCLDTTLELFEYERSLNPDIYQNYTNGSWFSPWWLQYADTLWMMSGDSGGGGTWPQLSLRDGATTYRDTYFFQSFNNPERCPRPVIPIANFMTHGILFSKSKPFTDFKDTLHDWSNYVVMYYARGTMLKELYITPELLDDDHWKVLGMASNWAVRNQERLLHTILIGGDAAKGEVYGYVSWVDGRAILTVRNPDRRGQTLEIPFDARVYYRGKAGLPYHARAIYPFAESMPWKLTSGEEFSVRVPGDSVIVYELEPGEPQSSREIRPEPLPKSKAEVEESTFELTLRIPDEDLQRYDLLVQPWAVVGAKLTVNGKPVEPKKSIEGRRWSLFALDLRKHRGKTLQITGEFFANETSQKTQRANFDVWLVADRKITAPSVPQDKNAPFAISQNYRRVTQCVVPRSPIRVKKSARVP